MKKYSHLIIFYLIVFSMPGCAQELPAKGICAHRGANNNYPENTLPAIKEAVRLGVQMIEFDIRKTKDNVLVVIHNDEVDETTNGKGKVEDFTFEEIRKLDAGSWKDPKFKNEKIPTFEEVLNVIPQNILMNIHIKDNSAAIAEKVAKIITKRNLVKNSVVACDNTGLTAVRKINPKIKICYMERGNSVDEYVDGTIKVKTEYIQLKREAFGDIFNVVKKLKTNGIVVNYYYAKTKEESKKLFDAGVDFVLVNNPDEMMRYKKEIEEESINK
jgi:glycerophosphoryl diester phosphodiesterase